MTMKKNLLFNAMILLAGILFFGFRDSSIAKMPSDAVDISFDEDLTYYVPCLGESVHVTGPVHAIMTMATNNNKMNWTMHLNSTGLSGTGLTSGKIFQASENMQMHGTESLVNGQYNFTMPFSFKLKGPAPGTGDTYRQKGVMIFTVTANGDVNHDIFKFREVDCGQ
jgi:hypothetical protein